MIGFDDLSNRDKLQIIISNAAFVTSVQYYHTVVKLYSLSNVFIEVQFNATTEEVKEINALNMESIEKYLKRIELKGLY